MICGKCGEENNDRFTFCTACGASLKSPPTDEQSPAAAALSAEDTAVIKSAERQRLARAESLIGQTLDGKYRLNSVIGAGRTGAVYRATRLRIEDEVAVKIFNLEDGDADFAARFMSEVRAAARFKHPNATTIYDFDFSEDSRFCIVTELAAGQSLRQIIKKHGAISPETVSVITAQVCDALDEAHRQGILHGDIKPHNIIVSQAANGGVRVKVLDFGLAQLPAAKASDLKKPGLITGTLRYMSPEQCLGEQIDGRSDIYSFGAVIYEMLAGASPFSLPHPTAAVAVQHVAKPPAPLSRLNPGISPEVEAVVMRSLEKRREDRQQTAADLARELHNAVFGNAAAAAMTTDDLNRTISSGGFASNNNPPPPANAFRTGSAVPVNMPAVYSTPGAGSQATSDLPSPTLARSASPKGDSVIAPPTFASNLSYREGSGKAGRILLAAGAAAVLLLIFAVIVWRQMRETGTSGGGENQNVQVKTDTNAAGNSAPGVDESGGGNPAPKSSGAADEELNRIRGELDNNAGRRQKAAIERELKNAESRFPEDYRFAYQRAKLEAATSRSHHEAFEMLFGAGAKAIRAEKSADLLSDLQRDGGASLKRLIDHKEWTILENALRKNDSKALEVKEH